MSDPNNLDALLRSAYPAWPEVRQWLALSPRSVEILPADRTRGEHTMLHLQASIESALGAVALETGGILLDSGWLRLLGSGSERMQSSLLTWNATSPTSVLFRGGIIVAFDVVGGFFAINAGAFPGDPGDIYYVAPDTLRWQNLAMTYSHFLYWAAHSDLSTFYENMRWPGWETEVASLDGDTGILCSPALSSGLPATVAQRSRKAVPILELWGTTSGIARQLENDPDA